MSFLQKQESIFPGSQIMSGMTVLSMAKKNQVKSGFKYLNWGKQGLLYTLIILVTIFTVYLGFLGYYKGKIFPGIKVASTMVAGQTPQSAHQLLASQFQQRANNPLKFESDNKSFEVELSIAGPQVDLGAKIKSAYLVGRTDQPLQDFKDQLTGLLFGKNFELELTYQDTTKLAAQLETINKSIKQEPQDAVVVVAKPITVNPSQPGLSLDTQALNQQLDNYLKLSSPAPSSLPTKVNQPGFTTASAEKAKVTLESVQDNPLVLSYQDQKWEINQPTLYSLLDIRGDKLLDEPVLTEYLKSIAKRLDQPMKNPRFQVDPSTPLGASSKPRVTEFQAAQEGQELDIEQTKSLIKASLADGTRQITLPVRLTKPSIGTADTNNLGIEELLAQGVSHFSGSIENRIYNLKLAASRINGVLIAPGETFSWNQTVGDISAATGYRQAYIIKSGRTVLDDGGGVCQTSTTLFRAVLNAGLPITSRTAHAYRVGYYEQGFPPGLDATIFHPTVDFKFKNDTGKHLLVQAYSSGYSLFVDLYGTSDGRNVELTKPAIYNQTPPPPELRQDDPTLPKGVIKQVDWAAWGAQVSFKRTVLRSGEKIIDETFYSNYKPWQAVYLVGTL